jgi:AcrR family transcriptional regulator/DNA-binding MarR family transcriptional regulator
MTARTPTSRRARRPAKAVARAPSTQAGAYVRARLLTAAEQIVRAGGVESLTVASLCSTAHVSRRTFYAVFADRTDCVLALFDALTDRATTAMAAACSGEQTWVGGVRAALTALLVALDRSPSLARFLIVYSAAGEPPMLTRRVKAIRRLARALDAGRPVELDGSVGAPFGSEAIVGAVASILHSRLLEDPVPSLAGLRGPLMGVIVLPYLGVEAAREELARPARRARARNNGYDALAGPEGAAARLEMRVTTRTLATLATLAEHPGISSRQVADAAGVSDRSHISRVLVRMRRMGLIVEDAHAATVGSRKAWRVTPAGRELLDECAVSGSKRVV